MSVDVAHMSFYALGESIAVEVAHMSFYALADDDPPEPPAPAGGRRKQAILSGL